MEKPSKVDVFLVSFQIEFWRWGGYFPCVFMFLSSETYKHMKQSSKIDVISYWICNEDEGAKFHDFCQFNDMNIPLKK